VRYSVTQLGGACPESDDSVAQAASASLIRTLLKPDAATILRRQTMGKFKKTSYMASLSLLTAALFLASPKPVQQRKITRRLDSKSLNFQTSYPIRPESIFPSFRNKFQKN
jgi:hypothetical protein